MKKINEDIYYNLRQVPASLLRELSNIDKNEISDSTREKVAKLTKNLIDIEDKEPLDIIKIMAKMDIYDMSNLILNIEKVDKKFSTELINGLNRLDNKMDDDAVYVADKLLKIYRLNVFSSVFSTKRIQALELNLRSYK